MTHGALQQRAHGTFIVFSLAMEDGVLAHTTLATPHTRSHIDIKPRLILRHPSTAYPHCPCRCRLGAQSEQIEGAEVRLRHGVEAAEDADLCKDSKNPPRAQAPLEPESPPPDPTQLTYAITLTPTLPYPTGTLRRTCASMRHMAASEEAGARAVPSAASG